MSSSYLFTLSEAETALAARQSDAATANGALDVQLFGDAAAPTERNSPSKECPQCGPIGYDRASSRPLVGAMKHIVGAQDEPFSPLGKVTVGPLNFIRDGGFPALCGCDVCEQLYEIAGQAAEKSLVEHDFGDFKEAERLEAFLNRQVTRIYPRHVANEKQRPV